MHLKRQKGTVAYILSLYGDSLSAALHVVIWHSSDLTIKAAFPEHNWILGRFLYPPKNVWQSRDVCRQFMDYLKDKLQLVELDDWYNVTRRQVVNFGGTGIISHFGNLPEVLKWTYPERQWVLGRFIISPKGTWEDGKSVREFLDYLGEVFALNELDDWYRFSRDDVDKLGGRELVNRYGGLEGLLRHAYPEHSWVSGRFAYALRNSWSKPPVVREFLEFVRQKLGISKESDWYSVSAEQISGLGGGGLYMKFGSLGQALQFAYPDTDWKLERFCMRGKKTRQKYVLEI